MSLITAQQQREAAAANTVAEVPPELVETMVIPEPVPVSLSSIRICRTKIQPASSAT